MLVHTSGKTIDHRSDKQPIEDVFQALADVDLLKFDKVIADLRRAAGRLYSQADVEGFSIISSPTGVFTAS